MSRIRHIAKQAVLVGLLLVACPGCGFVYADSSFPSHSSNEVSQITVLPAMISPSSTAGQPTLSNYSSFLDQLAEDTWQYLSSDWATTHYLPWSWRSQTLPGGDYANPAEIGFLALSWLGAYEQRQPWSPTWAETDQHVQAILDQLRAWQTGSQVSQPNGPNAYLNKVFYQWYWISQDPPVVGAASGDNHLVPSVDNAWLAASLITIQQYTLAHGHSSLAMLAGEILEDMDFNLWFDPASHLYHWGDVEDPQGGSLADYYSNENRIINFIARSLNDLDAEKYLLSLQALNQSSGSYGSSLVQKVAWDGSYFTYSSPALFIRENQTPYNGFSLTPATQAQIDYAQNAGYSAWGLSDCFDLGSGEYIQQGAPPAASSDPLETQPGLVSPHASALALITPLHDEALANLQTLSTSFSGLYHPGYGFLDSVMADPDHPSYGQTSVRFSALNQEWIFLALLNARDGFIWEYFYRHPGVQAAHREMYPPVFLPLIKIK